MCARGFALLSVSPLSFKSTTVREQVVNNYIWESHSTHRPQQLQGDWSELSPMSSKQKFCSCLLYQKHRTATWLLISVFFFILITSTFRMVGIVKDKNGDNSVGNGLKHTNRRALNKAKSCWGVLDIAVLMERLTIILHTIHYILYIQTEHQ